MPHLKKFKRTSSINKSNQIHPVNPTNTIMIPYKSPSIIFNNFHDYSHNSLHSDDMKDYSNNVSNIFDMLFNSRLGETRHYATFFMGKNHWLNSAIGINHIMHNNISEHAEINALKMNKSLTYSKDTINLFVIRLTKTGKIGESRPCYHCLLHLQKYCSNIGFVYYSTSDGKIIRERLINMINSCKTHVSFGNRHRLLNISF